VGPIEAKLAILGVGGFSDHLAAFLEPEAL
jgi:hypothetical protein